MKLIEKGLNNHSHMYFFSPSPMAKSVLYYPLCAGEFFCDDNYRVERNCYDSFLLLLVADGEIILESENEKYSAVKGEMLLVDCYKKHCYYSESFAHTLWLHIDGVNSKQLFYEIISQNGVKQKYSAQTVNCVSRLIENIKHSESEYELSSEIHFLLCSLLRGEISYQSKKVSVIEEAKSFVEKNYMNQIGVEDIANSVNMSASYFSKVFKGATTYSPYDYLLSVRLERAKELLLNSDYSISEIAFKTGFNRDANFIYCFKNATSVSPLRFRKMKF